MKNLLTTFSVLQKKEPTLNRTDDGKKLVNNLFHESLEFGKS